MLEIASPYQAPFTRLGLDSFDAISKFFVHEALPQNTAVIVRRSAIVLAGGAGLEVFYKQYEFASPSWKFIGRASKARCEWDNYAVFTRLGIPCAEAIACGEQRDALGRLRRAFILTRAVSDAPTLIEFWREIAGEKTRRARSIRLRLARELASMTRRIHDANFFHHDLVWRNILVTSQNPDEPKLWWIDCPRGSFDSWSPWQNRKRLKDLASLDKSAVKFCPPRERLVFLKTYLGKKQLDAEVKSFARAVVDYRRTRWPEDWEGK